MAFYQHTKEVKTMETDLKRADQTDDGNDLLTHIAVLSGMRSLLGDTMWEIIAQARQDDIALRRIARVSGYSVTHIRRKLEEM
jgi:hypothetical protein